MCAPNRSVKFHLVLFIWQHFTKTAPTINKDSTRKNPEEGSNLPIGFKH